MHIQQYGQIQPVNVGIPSLIICGLHKKENDSFFIAVLHISKPILAESFSSRRDS